MKKEKKRKYKAISEKCIIRLYLQILSGAHRLLMQSHREPKQAPPGFPLFDHRKPFIYIKSSASLRPVARGQNSAE